MATVIVVTSGKGGVGKTTTSASFGAGLALEGHKTVIIDFDIGLRNLDLVMGCERRVVFDIAHVIHREATVSQALIKDKRLDNLFVLAASQTRDKDILNEASVTDIIEQLKESFEYIICDSPAGIEKGAHMAMYHADVALVVANPEISSVRDSDRIIGLIQSKTKRAKEGNSPVKEYLIITRYVSKRAFKEEMLELKDIQELLGIPILGVVPESTSVLTASNAGLPVILQPRSDAGEAYRQVVAKFLDKAPTRKASLWDRVFKRKEAVV